MEYNLWIDGQWVDSLGGGRLAVENPATGQKIAEVPDGSRADVDRAVQAAKTAFYKRLGFVPCGRFLSMGQGGGEF